MKSKVYIILPKLSAYQYKEDKVQSYLRKEVFSMIEFLKSWKDKELYCFAEDMLAVELFAGDFSMKWISAIGEQDRNFILYSVIDYPESYNSLTTIKVHNTLIRQAVSKYKACRVTDFAEQSAYRAARFIVLNNRIKFVVQEVLENADFLVFFDAGNNFCACPKPRLGDGKVMIHMNLLSHLTIYTYGGIPLSKNEFETVVRME